MIIKKMLAHLLVIGVCSTISGASLAGSDANTVKAPALPAPDSLPPLPGSPAQIKENINARFPLSDSEIEMLKRKIMDTESAVHKSPLLATKNPLISVNVGPGSVTPIIHVAKGYVTTLSVLDQQGNPWTVTSYTSGGGKAFAVHAVVEGGASGDKKNTTPSNLLTVTPNSESSSTNLMLTMDGSADPIMLVLVANGPDDTSVDGMVSLRIDRDSPLARPPVVMPPPPTTVQPDLLLFLNQVPPKGADPVDIHSGFDLQVWGWKDQMVVRTILPLLSPAWSDEVEQNNVRVYVIPKSQVLLFQTEQGPKEIPIE